MNPNDPHLKVIDAANPVDPQLEPLLSEPFARLWLADDVSAAAAAVRGRLLLRVGAARAAADDMHTVRRARIQPTALTAGVSRQLLYVADGGRPARPGEPLCAYLLELAPGGIWAGPSAQPHREWLVLQGAVRLGSEWLTARDYHVAPAGTSTPPLRADERALVFVRESMPPTQPGGQAFTVHDHDAGWPEYAPGIRRRVLWQQQGQAALLYHAQPGAQVPRHTHGHDEECLMVQGTLYLDDVLLQAGDYQLAPAGTGHRITETDTGVVIYAHGDLDLQFVA
jgi:quercetin dioxygenase-like cupin family protein